MKIDTLTRTIIKEYHSANRIYSFFIINITGIYYYPKEFTSIRHIKGLYNNPYLLGAENLDYSFRPLLLTNTVYCVSIQGVLLQNMNQRKAKLSELCNLIGVSFIGDDVEINGLNLCNRETTFESILGYTTNANFFDAILSNKAVKALVLSKELLQQFHHLADSASRSFSYIVSSQPEYLFYDAHNLLWNKTDFYDHYQQETVIGTNCDIHPSVVIEKGVKIGNNVQIGPNSVVRHGSVIDDNVYIGCCSVIGSEGFQGIKGYPRMIKHVGGTHLCHDAYIGDNTTIGNALFEGETVVGPYSKVDNHVHFAHNCRCGENCFITACSLLMGSTILDNNVWLAPNAVTLNGVHVHNDGFVGAVSFANKDVLEGEIVAGIPAKVLRKLVK